MAKYQPKHLTQVSEKDVILRIADGIYTFLSSALSIIAIALAIFGAGYQLGQMVDRAIPPVEKEILDSVSTATSELHQNDNAMPHVEELTAVIFMDDCVNEETAEIKEKPQYFPLSYVAEDPVVDYNHDNVDKHFEVFSKSGLDAEQIEMLLTPYPDLHGLGSAIYNTEQEHGVNAYYTLGVLSLESGFGTSWLAKNKNNLFGMRNCTFQTPERSIDYFGRLMISYRDDRNLTMTPNGINPTYCELDSWCWKVVSLMNKYINTANESF